MRHMIEFDTSSPIFRNLFMFHSGINLSGLNVIYADTSEENDFVDKVVVSKLRSGRRLGLGKGSGVIKDHVIGTDEVTGGLIIDGSKNIPKVVEALEITFKKSKSG